MQLFANKINFRIHKEVMPMYTVTHDFKSKLHF